MLQAIISSPENITISFSKHLFLRIILLGIAFLATTAAYAQQPFITTWQTNNLGTGGSNSTTIVIPTTGNGYNYEVDWNNDGTYDESGITGNVTHNFGVAGTYTIRIRGAFPRIYFNNTGDRRKLVAVTQWGDQVWTSMNNAFYGCINLNVTATDVPNLSGLTDLSGMFFLCSSLTGPANIGTWNMAGVTNISYMFRQASVFNQPIGTWNTAAVTNMSYLFSDALAFNQPIGNWNTSNVTNMNSMLALTDAFNQPINNWNTANVTNMGFLFADAHVFNQPIGNWNTGNVTFMGSMFVNANAFNQPIGNWNTANVTYMGSLFNGCAVFNQPIGNWNTGNVTFMGSMFVNATVFNQPIGNWNTVKVTNMSNMFASAPAFNQPLANWNTANVTNMSGMFLVATAFNQSLGNWTLNAAVELTNTLNNTGMDCDNYSATLIGWSNNPATPNGRFIGAQTQEYGTNAVTARTNLTTTKGWTIIGDTPSGLACPAPLPTELLAFSGKQQGNGILLEWQTASEQNNKGFHIERSEDGLRWTEIGFVAGKGTITERQDYAFLDEKPFLPPQGGTQGGLYYRLRQTDFNNKEEISKVVSIDLQTVGTVRVFPNPVSTGQLTLFLSENTEEEIIVNLFSPLGQLVRSMVLGNGSNALDIKALPTGTYTLQIVRGTESAVEKIVVQH